MLNNGVRSSFNTTVNIFKSYTDDCYTSGRRYPCTKYQRLVNIGLSADLSKIRGNFRAENGLVNIDSSLGYGELSSYRYQLCETNVLYTQNDMVEVRDSKDPFLKISQVRREVYYMYGNWGYDSTTNLIIYWVLCLSFCCLIPCALGVCSASLFICSFLCSLESKDFDNIISYSRVETNEKL